MAMEGLCGGLSGLGRSLVSGFSRVLPFAGVGIGVGGGD